MVKAGLGYEDVAAVATVLAEIGQEVSVNSVRRHLGTGSRFIIGRHLARWKSEQLGPSVDVGVEEDSLEVPPPPTTSLTHALESLGTALRAATETQIEPLDERLHQLAGELTTLREELSHGDAGIADQIKELAGNLRSGDKGLAKKIDQVNKRLEASDQRLAVSEERLEALGQEIAHTAREWQAKAEDLGTKLQHLAHEHTALLSELLTKLDGLYSAHNNLMQSLRDHQHQGQSQIAALEERLVALSDSVIDLLPRGEIEKPKKKKE